MHVFLYSYLSEDELIPVIGDLHPSEHYYAKQQADYVISEVPVEYILTQYYIHIMPRYKNAQKKIYCSTKTLVIDFDKTIYREFYPVMNKKPFLIHSKG